MAKRKPQLDDAGNEIPLAELPKLPILTSAAEIEAAITAFGEHKAISKARDALEEQLEQQLMDSIFNLGQVEYEIPEVVKAVVRNRTTRTIEAASLLAAGVEPHIIEAATRVTVSKAWLQLYPKKS